MAVAHLTTDSFRTDYGNMYYVRNKNCRKTWKIRIGEVICLSDRNTNRYQQKPSRPQLKKYTTENWKNPVSSQP